MAVGVQPADATAQTTALLRIADVLALVPISRASFYRLVARGEAPRPVHLGRTALWRASEIETWIASLGRTA